MRSSYVKIKCMKRKVRYCTYCEQAAICNFRSDLDILCKLQLSSYTTFEVGKKNKNEILEINSNNLSQGRFL